MLWSKYLLVEIDFAASLSRRNELLNLGEEASRQNKAACDVLQGALPAAIIKNAREGTPLL